MAVRAARHLPPATGALTDRGARLPTSAYLPLWCDHAAVEALRMLPASVTSGNVDRLCLAPVPEHLLAGPTALRQGWRSLYTARLMEALQRIDPAVLAERWQTLDPCLRLEAAFVLRRDHRVPADTPTEAEFYAAFVIDFLGMWRFERSAVDDLFPTASDPDATAARLAEGLNEPAMFAATEPAGAGGPGDMEVRRCPVATGPLEPPPPEQAKALAAFADRALKHGNAARAAIACTQAAAAHPTGSTKHRQAAKAAIKDDLVPQLAAVFGWHEAKQQAWCAALAPVLAAAGESYWCPAAKFLYDLQRLAADLRQDIYAVDPPGWLLSRGRRPMIRKLTLQRQTILLVHLHRTAKHFDKAALAETDREVLEGLLRDETHAAEAALHKAVHPLLESAFDRAGLVPTSTVETVARRKVAEELIDRIAGHGHIRLGDLRDAFARSAFKLPDLAGPGEWLRGDALLRADRIMALELDGIYHRGEVYLRWFQRGSAAAFGTRLGRLLTRFAVIPAVAACMTVAFAQYLEHEAGTIAKAVRHLVKVSDPEETEYVMVLDANGVADWVQEVKEGHKAIEFTDASWVSVGILAVVYLLLANVPILRDAVFRLIGMAFRGLGFALFTLPGKLWHSPLARWVRRNRVARFVSRSIVVPVVAGGIAAAFVAAFGGSRTLVFRTWAIVTGVLALVLLTPRGDALRRSMEERAADFWRAFRRDWLPGLLSLVAGLFRWLLGRFEALVYTIDEWFRYREGQSKPSLALKVALGVVWFPIAYVLRFALFLLIEPQVNPLKHFPTVTVAHKLLLPMIPTVATATGISLELVGTVFTGIPGVFGFLVWELKENWRLYAANRPEHLKPVPLGHHGETMRGLLRPGFHSGTVPAEYRKVRNAMRKAGRTGESVVIAPKPLAGLHAVEHALHAFVERDLVAYLGVTPCWSSLVPSWHALHVGVQCVRVEFSLPEHCPAPVSLVFSHLDGSIHGRVEGEGFVPMLTSEQRAVWEMAVKGFFALAAVEGESELVPWAVWQDFWDRAAGWDGQRKSPGLAAGAS